MAQTKITGGLISTTSNYEVGVITATKFVGPFGDSSDRGIGYFSSLDVTGNANIGGTLSYVDVDNITATGIITAQDSVQIGAGLSVAGISTFVGIATFGSGVGIADSIFHLSDTNTAIRFPADDTITFETNGDEEVRINSDGQLILGSNPTVAADAALHIELDGTREYLRLEGDVGTSNAYLEIEAPNNRRKALIFKSGGTRRGIIGVGDSDEATDATSLFFSASDKIAGNDPHMVIASTGKIGINETTPEELLDLGENNQQNLKVGQRGYLGQAYSTAATILGHSVKAKTTGTTAGGMIVTETNSGGGAPSAIRQESGTIQFHTAASGTADADFDSEKVRITSSGTLGINTTNTGGNGLGVAVDNNNTNVLATGSVAINLKNINTTDNSWVSMDFNNSVGGIVGRFGAQFKDTSDKDTDLYFATRQDGGALSERLRITSVGDVEFSGTAAGVSSCTWDASANTLKFQDDSKAIYGAGNDLEIYHTAGGDSIIHHTAASGSTLRLRSRGFTFKNQANNQTIATLNEGDACKLFFSNSEKIATTTKGISVTGEVAATQDYPNIRPVLDFNFAATKKLDPRMEFYSTGEASYHDGVGSVKFVPNNVPRFEHDIISGDCKGLMVETAGTNYSWYSRTFDSIASGSWVPQNGGATPTVTANSTTAPDGTSSGSYMADTISGATGTAFNGNVVQQQHTAGANVKHTFSLYIKFITATQATIYIRDGATGSVSSASAINTRNWQRVVVTSSAALTNSTMHSFYIGNTNGDIAVWGSQIERSDYVSSYIRTESGANGTRVADAGGVRLGGEDVTDIFNQGEGTLIAEVIPTLDEANQGIVGFYQDFGSVNRIELRAQGTTTANARFESVVGSSSVVNMTGSAHAGVNNVSKYAYAFQENNYAASVNGGTVETDTSGAFPHGTGINSMIIGDAVYAKEHSMIIKRVMYYADRLPDSQLVTLTS